MIPARMASSRFPGKPLLPLLGIPMIEHVYKRCAMAMRLDDLYIATCDGEIYETTKAFGGNAVMTADTHERASDRIAEAAQLIDADIYVLIQGDEPLTTPEMIDAAVAPLSEGASVECVNLMKRILREDDFHNPDIIKVVVDKASNAVYMSRRAIPSHEKMLFKDIKAFKQVCIIPFTKYSLKLYGELKPTPLEIVESVDMNRFIEHGFTVRMVETAHDSHAVDRPEDVALVEKLLSEDPLLNRYAS